MNSKGLRELAIIIIITILGTYYFSYAAFIVFQNNYPSSLLEIWKHWDTVGYLDIAERGYSSTTVGERHLRIVFFPFYPFLIRLFAFVFKNYMLSALLVSNLAYAFSAYYLYKLVLIDYSKEDAIRAVVYLSIFPTSYFLHAAYTESAFLALTIGSFYYARKEKWFISSLVGMFACATRINGIVMIPVLLTEYLLQRRFKISNIKRDISWIALVPLGFLSYLIINYIVFDDPFKFIEFQKGHWSKTLTYPWYGLLGAWGSAWWRPPTDTILVGWAELIFGVFGLILTLWSMFYLRKSYVIYMFITWLTITSTSFLLSTPRYTLSMFPLFISFSLIGRREELNYLITFVSLLFLGLFLTHFILGRWAF